MQVYIYICWQLELSGNANLRLYQCWFAFTHRSPIKKFASCRLREKNFASLRLRKNLVELRARLSLLVDKTTFKYSVLTIYYTTIDGHAPSLPSPSARRGRRGRPGRARISPTHHARQGRGKEGATNAPGSPPPAPAAVVEGTPWARPDHHQHRTPRKRGTPWTLRDHHPRPQPRKDGTRPDQHTATPAVAEGEGGRCAGSYPAPARRGGRDALDAPGSPPPAPPAVAEAKIGGYMPAYFTFLSKINV